MHEVSIHTMDQLNRFSKRFRSITWQFFMDISMNRTPVLLDCFEVTEVRFKRPEPNAKVLHLQQVTTDALQPFKVTSSWSHMAR